MDSLSALWENPFKTYCLFFIVNEEELSTEHLLVEGTMVETYTGE